MTSHVASGLNSAVGCPSQETAQARSSRLTRTQRRMRRTRWLRDFTSVLCAGGPKHDRETLLRHANRGKPVGIRTTWAQASPVVLCLKDLLLPPSAHEPVSDAINISIDKVFSELVTPSSYGSWVSRRMASSRPPCQRREDRLHEPRVADALPSLPAPLKADQVIIVLDPPESSESTVGKFARNGPSIGEFLEMSRNTKSRLPIIVETRPLLMLCDYAFWEYAATSKGIDPSPHKASRQPAPQIQQVQERRLQKDKQINHPTSFSIPDSLREEISRCLKLNEADQAYFCVEKLKKLAYKKMSWGEAGKFIHRCGSMGVQMSYESSCWASHRQCSLCRSSKPLIKTKDMIRKGILSYSCSICGVSLCGLCFLKDVSGRVGFDSD